MSDDVRFEVRRVVEAIQELTMTVREVAKARDNMDVGHSCTQAVELDRLRAFVARVAADGCRWVSAGLEPCEVQCGEQACVACKAASLLRGGKP